MDVKVTVPFEVVYPNEEISHRGLISLLKELSLTDTLITIARLNLAINDPLVPDLFEKQHFAVRNFLGNEEVARINEFAKQHGGVRNVIPFTRPGLLEMMRWAALVCENHENDGDTFSDLNLRKVFGKAAILATDLWNLRVYKPLSNLGAASSVDEKRRKTIGVLRQGIADASYEVDPFRMLGRGLRLNRIFPEYYRDFEGDFEVRTGVSLEDYYRCLAMLTIHNWVFSLNEKKMPSELGNLIRVDAFLEAAPHLIPVFDQFVASESQSVAELRSGLWGTITSEDNAIQSSTRFDYKPLREKPLLRIDDGRIVILDPVFYADKAAVGPLFSSLKNDSIPAQEMFGYFGLTVEKYVQNMLRRMYEIKTTVPLLNRVATPVKRVNDHDSEVELADAGLLVVTGLVLFEIKAKWLQDDLVLDEDHEVFLRHVDERYGKYLRKFAKNIRNICIGKWTPNNIDISSTERIYPVFLVYDELLTTMQFTNYFNEIFRDALELDEIPDRGDMKLGDYHVTKLIVMSVQMLEDLETSVDEFALEELLSKYIAGLGEPVDSIKDYLAVSEYGKRLRHNKVLNSEIQSLIEDVLLSFDPGFDLDDLRQPM